MATVVPALINAAVAGLGVGRAFDDVWTSRDTCILAFLDGTSLRLAHEPADCPAELVAAVVAAANALLEASAKASAGRAVTDPKIAAFRTARRAVLAAAECPGARWARESINLIGDRLRQVSGLDLAQFTARLTA